MRIPLNRITVAVVLAAAAGHAIAWGPDTQVVIATTAARIISQEDRILLTNLQRDIQRGASVPAGTLVELLPLADQNPVQAIESEMYLLQAAGANRVDPYLAYRLGILGKLVARVTAPVAGLDSLDRARYDADADKNIERAVLQPSARRLVDPPVYFARVQREARAREDVIQKDYQAGIGFEGVARAALSEDISRSVDAVADVWHTILTGTPLVANVSEGQIHEYGLRAIEFYLDRGNNEEANNAYERVLAVGKPTAEFRKRIGDVFYEAGEYEQAIHEYEIVFEEDATRRDVVTKIAEYYVNLGDQALAEGRLEAAQDAYTRAGNADSLHPSAHEKRLQVSNLIVEREARLTTTRAALEQAKTLEEQADQQTRMRRYASAFELLDQAERLYREISNEFIAERRTAAVGLNKIAVLKRQLREELINSAERLSGSGLRGNTQQLAIDTSRRLSREVLQALVTGEYLALVDSLEEDLRQTSR